MTRARRTCFAAPIVAIVSAACGDPAPVATATPIALAAPRDAASANAIAADASPPPAIDSFPPLVRDPPPPCPQSCCCNPPMLPAAHRLPFTHYVAVRAAHQIPHGTQLQADLPDRQMTVAWSVVVVDAHEAPLTTCKIDELGLYRFDCSTPAPIDPAAATELLVSSGPPAAVRSAIAATILHAQRQDGETLITVDAGTDRGVTKRDLAWLVDATGAHLEQGAIIRVDKRYTLARFERAAAVPKGWRVELVPPPGDD